MSSRRAGGDRARLHGNICLAACLVGFVLRLYRIEAQSLWWDEAVSLHLATSSVGAVLADRAANIHPPLYFLLLKAWAASAGVSAFSARFLSVLLNVPLIAGTHAYARRCLGGRTGLIAAALSAIVPLYIVYSQEVRVYAFLPVVYLAMLAVGARVARCERTHGCACWRSWLALVVIESVGLYLHYATVLAVAYVNLMLLIRLWRSRQAVRRWAASLAATAACFLPWLAVAYTSRNDIRAIRTLNDPFVDKLPFVFFIDQTWTFLWTGLISRFGSALLSVTLAALAGVLVVGLILVSLRSDGRRAALSTLVGWIGPLLPALLLWQVKPLSHPRYVLTFSVALHLTAAYVIARLLTGRRLLRVLGASLVGLLCLISVTGLRAWYLDPQAGKDDVRGVAAWLDERVDSDSVVLALSGDWTLDFAQPANQAIGDHVVRVDPGDAETTWRSLAVRTVAVDQVYVVTYPRDDRDRRNLIPFALDAVGRLAEIAPFKGPVVHAYAIDRPAERPSAWAPDDARFGPLRLTGSWIESDVMADTAVAVSFRWRLDEDVAERYRVSLRLQDLDGWTWSSVDDWLLDSEGRPTEAWETSAESATYHVLPVPPGLPPVTYTLSVGVYHSVHDGSIVALDLLDAAGNPAGRYLPFGVANLRSSLGVSGDPYDAVPELEQFEVANSLGSGLELAAFSVDRQTVAPGQSVSVVLRWRAAAEPMPDLRPAVLLDQEGVTIAAVDEPPANGRYPTSRWLMGQEVLDHRLLTIGPEARPGPATIAVQLDGRRISLASVEVEAPQPTYESPRMEVGLGTQFADVAELVGYDLQAGPFVSGEPITITLYWRAFVGAAAADRTVFVHLLAADGHLVAQHDGLPAGGDRPTSGWRVGEIIADTHEVTFREPYAGPSRIEVGLYDTATVDRVLTIDGQDAVVLPTSIEIEAP